MNSLTLRMFHAPILTIHGVQFSIDSILCLTEVIVRREEGRNEWNESCGKYTKNRKVSRRD